MASNFQQQLENELWEYWGSMLQQSGMKGMNTATAQAHSRIIALLVQELDKLKSHSTNATNDYGLDGKVVTIGRIDALIASYKERGLLIP